MVNVNEETGIRYGLISSNALNFDYVDMVQREGESLSEKEAVAEFKREIEIEIENGAEIDDVDAEVSRRLERWECDEEIHHYVETDDDGNPRLIVQTSWLGGALLLWVFLSPKISRARLCSPCAPGAGDLDNLDEDGYECYDVPDGWREDAAADTAVLAEVDAAYEELPPEDPSPGADPHVCEIVLPGGNEADPDDEYVLRVVTSMECDDLEAWVRARGVAFDRMCKTSVHPSEAGVDFDLPEEEHDFLAYVRRMREKKA